ncbi:MAG: helix-turn-helix domain-containing protein [Clostridia bacterium]|nr:helix-turn-helix domain-containing protein [Clostridia bacterium]MBR4439419.1 helix-turn-helix domain-containing protein [Clostridia bacterium]MBR5943200.1 helix-turn-helix domain-containing protein [Clostridia bacterium]
MSNRLFQSVIQQMKDVTGRTIGVIDESNAVIACSDLSLIGKTFGNVMDELSYTSEALSLAGRTYKKLGWLTKADYAVFVEGEDERARYSAAILAVSLDNIKGYYDEKYDKSAFIKNVLLDNILPGELRNKVGELQINNEVGRVVMLVRVDERSDISLFDVIRNLFPEKNQDFVIRLDENEIAVVKEVKEHKEPVTLDKLGVSIVDTLKGEFFADATVGISNVVSTVAELARAFKEAQTAIEVGKVFESENGVVNYANLGIARLIYHLPTTLCEMYMDEVFKSGTIDSLDHETLFTIQKFFENNLNVSETSRKLFVHRNTLVYRLDKIKKLTGLDLREFENAIVFKVALMVHKYLQEKPVKY